MIKIKLLKNYSLVFVGVHNVTALSNLITWQKVDYDFSYHQMEFPCNINVFITSEGRSLLPVMKGHFKMDGGYIGKISIFLLCFLVLLIINKLNLFQSCGCRLLMRELLILFSRMKTL